MVVAKLLAKYRKRERRLARNAGRLTFGSINLKYFESPAHLSSNAQKCEFHYLDKLIKERMKANH